jgi:hypothetical protein
MNFVELLPTALVLSLLQVAAAIPWLGVVGWEVIVSWFREPGQGGAVGKLLIILGIVLGLTLIPIVLLNVSQEREALETYGRVYAAVLHLQLCLDAVAIPMVVMLWVWPKGGAVALAAFREGVRQPMFWLLGLLALGLMAVSPFIPYFTFGEDFIMVKQLGYDLIMLAALIFGVLAASMSITEEIEGRTAVTLMSKPVSRRQFLIGKFLGILLAGLGMTLALSWCFNWVLVYKRGYDAIDQIPPPPLPVSWTEFLDSRAATPAAADFLRGAMQWAVETGDVLPGVVLGFCQVMVLLAVATALATRLPLVVNLVTCLLVYFLGHLTPVLVHIARRRQELDPSQSAVSQLLTFMAQLFDTLVPSLDLFRIDSALLSDAPPPLDQFFFHVGQSFVLAVMYSVIGLLLGLILFEDRDLA